jgi:cytochrome c-type biogenesis protein
VSGIEQFTFPFGVGLLAAVNPCGFAMLPTYLGFFLGTETAPRSRLRAVTRGLWVGTILTLGFVAVFGSVGLLISWFVNQATVVEHVGLITVVIGVLLVPVGVAILLGRSIRLPVLGLARAGSGRGVGSVFLFGVSYAVVSLSCTLGLFLQAVNNTFTTDGVANGVGSFIAYGLGMGAVVVFLTVSLAWAKSGVASGLRRILPYVEPLSGLILIAAGIYLIDYGIWEIRLQDDINAGNLMVDQFLGFQATISGWISDATPQRLGVLSLFAVSGLLLLAWRSDHPRDTLRRRSVTSLWLIFFVFVEAVNDWDFFVRPVLRLVIP